MNIREQQQPLSSPSLSSSVELVDLQDRFDQLFADYTKARAQNVMLKKSMADLQNCSKSDKQALQSLEQTVKTSKRELDTLQLHNQRLVKRIESMQQSATTNRNSGNGARKVLGGIFGSSSSSPTNIASSTSPSSSPQQKLEVISDELRAKIAENAQLHSILKDQQDAHALELDESYGECEQMRRQMFDMKEELTSVVLKSEDQLIIMRRRIAEIESTNQQLKADMEALKQNAVDKTVVDELDQMKQRYEQTLKELESVKASLLHEQSRSESVKLQLENMQTERGDIENELEIKSRQYEKVIASKNGELDSVRDQMSALQNEVSQLNASITELRQQPPVTISEPSFDGIKLNLSDYWLRTTTDQEMDREHLLKRYYEDKIKNIFQSGEGKSIAQFESQYFDLNTSMSKTEVQNSNEL